MSNLLSQASLVMIPSGYKEDIVYSQIPTNGNGDLSFTRASNGTRVNSAGLVEVAPWNLVEYSEDFSNAYWGKDNLTITANSTTAPNGTTTADTLTRNAGTAYLYNGSFNLGVGEFTQSVYAKANASSSIRLEFVTGAFGRGAACIFDLSNGTAGTITIYGGVSGFTASIESVGNGWYRCSLGGTITIADTYYWEISITTGSIYVWGAQLNTGSTAKPYFPTTDRLNVPRLTYQNGGGGCPSLLLEKQSTNLALYSNALSTAPNTVESSSSTATANVYVSPDGTQNAMRFTETTANDRHGFYQYTTVTAQTYTASIFTKQTGRRYIALNSDITGTSATSFFDLQTISVVSSGSGHTCSIQDFGNGWLRLIVTFTATAGSRYLVWGGSANGTTDVYAGSTSISQTFYGYQLEASSYPTSYIPTTSSSATRVADAFALKDITSFSIGNAYTILLDVTMQSSDNNKLFFETRTSTNATSLTARNFNGALRLFNNIDASYPLAAVSSSTNKWVVRINGTSYDLFAVSGGIATKDSATITTARNFGYFELAGSTTQLYFDELVIFPTALTDAECQSLVL